MKNLSLYLNIVLFVAVGLLYYFHFSGKSGQRPSEATALRGNVVPDSVSSGIVYVNIDSLFKNYAFYSDIRTEMEQKQKRMETEFQKKGDDFQRRAADFQDKVSKQLITTRQAEEMQRQLAKEQEDLMRLKDQLSAQLMQAEQSMNRDLYDSIQSFLHHYNMGLGYQFIMGYTTGGGGILLADDKLDITNVVINGLNQRYGKKEEKKEKKEK